MVHCAALAALLASAVSAAPPIQTDFSVWPKPSNYSCATSSQQLPQGASLELVLSFGETPPARDAAELPALFKDEISPAIFAHHTVPAAAGAAIPLSVKVGAFAAQLALETNEDYTLSFADAAQGIQITAPTQLGAIHALESLSQLIYFDFAAQRYTLPASCAIADSPRFKHRGLLIDTGRHFEPLPQLEKILRTMRMNKLTVLHWHLVEIQSFPVRSELFPELSQQGAWSTLEQYTLGDLAYVVDFARKQGIRVVPEFDQPGHTGSMWYSHPELFACQPPASGMGSFGVAVNPLHENVYTFMNALMGELLAIFPDQYFHIGTDEVPEDCWKSLPGCVNDLNGCFQTYIDRVSANLTAGDFPTKTAPRKVIAWDEAVIKATPTDKANTVIQVWHQPDLIKTATDKGYKVIASPALGANNWYLDHLSTKWSDEYNWDPVIAGVDEANVLGGEGCMWGETVDVSDFDQTVWPRMSAIGERLWSPRAATQDLKDAESRLGKFRCLMNARGVGATVLGGGGRPALKGAGSCFQRLANVTANASA